MIRTVSIGVLAIYCGLIATAEDKNAIPLEPLTGSTASAEKKCLPFFVTTTINGAIPEEIVFAYKLPDGRIKRDAIPKSRAFVHLSTNPPTYQEAIRDEKSYEPIVRFRMTQADYEKAAACLPEPTPDPNPPTPPKPPPAK